MDEEDAVQKVEGGDKKEVIGAGGGSGEKTFEACYQADCD